MSSTCSIASFTCKWNYTYLTKNCHVKKKHGYHGTPTGTWVLSIFCLFRKTSLLFFLSLSAFVQVRRHFSNWPRKYMQRAWRKSNNTFSNRVAEVARSREGPSPNKIPSPYIRARNALLLGIYCIFSSESKLFSDGPSRLRATSAILICTKTFIFVATDVYVLFKTPSKCLQFICSK